MVLISVYIKQIGSVSWICKEQQIEDWQVEKLVQDGDVVIYRVVIDEVTTPVLLDLGLYFLVEKKEIHELLFFFIFSVYYMCHKRQQSNSTLPSLLYI